MLRFHIVVSSVAAAIAAQATVKPDPTTDWGTWQGWGVSLCWWANVPGLGDSDGLADVVYGNDTGTYEASGHSMTVPSLNFNIARYNVGGSSNVTVNGTNIVLSPNFPWWKQIKGYWIDGASTDPTSPSWDWSADALQRGMLSKAVARGANMIEFFSNSPMWWALVNHNPSGSNDGSSDNLAPHFWQSHAQYMAIVTAKAVADWGITSNPDLWITADPLNEPIATWWKADGTQEGCHFEHATQAAVIQYLRQELDARGLTSDKVKVSASDESLTDMGLATWQAFDSTTRAAIQEVNVHGYQGTAGNRSGLYQEAVVNGGKTLRLSEHGEGDATGQTLAQNILLDFHQLHMTSWVYWQVFDGGGWGLIPGDVPNAALQAPNPKYYALIQYTRHIRPGMRILNATGDALALSNTVIGYDSIGKTVVVVATNTGSNPLNIGVDLRAFSTASGPVTRWATEMANNGDKYAKYTDVSINNKEFSFALPPNTIVTFSAAGVSM